MASGFDLPVEDGPDDGAREPRAHGARRRDAHRAPSQNRPRGCVAAIHEVPSACIL